MPLARILCYIAKSSQYVRVYGMAYEKFNIYIKLYILMIFNRFFFVA